MRRATSLLLLAGSASAAFQFPFNLWPASNPPSPIEVTYTANPQSPRVAIIGAGAGGSSAAFWIAKAKERFGIDVEVDVYDRSNYIGGSEFLNSIDSGCHALDWTYCSSA